MPLVNTHLDGAQVTQFIQVQMFGSKNNLHVLERVNYFYTFGTCCSMALYCMIC